MLERRDAPSASALQTARVIERAWRAGALGDTAARETVPVHSVRLPGLYAHQEVLLSGPGEVLALRHDMLGPEAFGPGIALALERAPRCVGVSYGLEALLEQA